MQQQTVAGRADIKLVGDHAEKLAAQYLQRQGLILRASNYRCKFGELDLIMQEASTLVFVEVRLRSNLQYGGAADSITAAKQRKLALTAEYYLQQHGNAACRFDAILMDKADPGNIVWIRNAFET